MGGLMKRYILILFVILLSANSFSAQQNLALKGGGSTLSINDNFVKQQSMNTELYANKANVSCFADAASFNACFTLDWPTSGITYTAGTGITITDGVIASTVVDTDTFASWDKDYADLINKPTIPDITGLEPSLGNPSVNGYVLSSTTTGVRSWVEMTGGGTGIAHATADGNYYASKDGGWASLTGLYAPALGADDNYVTDAEKIKLAGIAEGAEVNVNADWNASSGDAQILNKPTIPTVSDAAYDATTWDGSTDAPSKNAIRDKIESMGTGGGTWGSITGTLSAQTDLQNALDAKANSTNISFVAAALSDIKYDPNTSVSDDEFAIIDATATYGGTYDDYQVWPVSKVGVELAGKLATTAIDDTKGNGDTGYVWSADKIYDQLALKIGGSTGSTDNALLRADGTGGSTAQSSGITVDDSDNLSTTGTLSGKVAIVVNSDTAAYSVTTAQARANTLFLTTNAATTTYTLPAAEGGMLACFKMGQGNDQILRIDTDGTDYIVKSTGVRTSAAGDYYGATASATNRICVAAYDTTDWYVESEVGTWAEE